MLPQAFLARMQAQLGAEYDAYLAAMERPVRRALRVNTLKIPVSDFCRICDFALTPTGAAEESFYFPDTLAIGRHPLHAAGLCYVQEPSATLPAPLLAAAPGMRVLDLCAAPGGKAGQLAAALMGEGLLVANEPVSGRASVLLHNLERLGAANVAVTCARPETLAEALPGFFHRVLVDAPCSGEGMFRKEPAALADWSPQTVRACALRQQGILDSAAAMLRPGGRLVYATCTFSAEEDEEGVAAFLDRHPDFSCLFTRKAYPHTGPGEGQFMALLQKDGEGAAAQPVPGREGGKQPREKRRIFDNYWQDTVKAAMPSEPAFLPDGRVVLPPAGMPSLPGIRVLRAGLLAGECRGDRLIPDHALFMGLPGEAFCRAVPVEGETALRFLAGETLPCDGALSGWCAVTYRGYPVGFGKAVTGTLKNHYPKGLHIPV